MNPHLESLLSNTFFTINKQNEEYHQRQLFDDDFKPLEYASKRIFTAKQKEDCWKLSEIIPGRDPNRWRYDAIGNPVLKQLKGCGGPLCHEYDHILPFSKGGETKLNNCQILQTKVNREKSNKINLTDEEMRKSSIRVKLSDLEMDYIEKMVYGNVRY